MDGSEGGLTNETKNTLAVYHVLIYTQIKYSYQKLLCGAGEKFIMCIYFYIFAIIPYNFYVALHGQHAVLSTNQFITDFIFRIVSIIGRKAWEERLVCVCVFFSHATFLC